MSDVEQLAVEQARRYAAERRRERAKIRTAKRKRRRKIAEKSIKANRRG